MVPAPQGGQARGASPPLPSNTSTKVQKSTQVKFFAVKLNHIEIFTAKCYICDIFKYKLLHCSQQPNDWNLAKIF